ncbi:MAG: DNA-3-methyladenine glycosylase I [Rhodocyclaceae bacterium]|nr:MAG: DNA-3-methyladenine glycosylase I [Rhodocyclaceae bacterium]
MKQERCPWCGTDPLYTAYHDREWGVPCHDDRTLFEFLLLEGAQAGLSWITVLRKRENYRLAFDDFDVETIARYGDADMERLLANPGIVRNRLKVKAAMGNARATLALRDQGISLDEHLWKFVDARPQVNHWRTMAEVPASTPISDAMSKDLAKRGFKFVGSTICYAFMQATGMVNDHLVSCPRHRACQATG